MSMSNATTNASTPQQDKGTASPVIATQADKIVEPMDTTTTTERVEDPNEDKELLGIVKKELPHALDEARKPVFNFFLASANWTALNISILQLDVFTKEHEDDMGLYPFNDFIRFISSRTSSNELKSSLKNEVLTLELKKLCSAVEMPSLADANHSDTARKATALHDSFAELIKAQHIPPELRSLLEGFNKELKFVIIDIFVDFTRGHTSSKDLYSYLKDEDFIVQLGHYEGVTKGMSSILEAAEDAAEAASRLKKTLDQLIKYQGTPKRLRSLLKRLYRALRRGATLSIFNYVAKPIRDHFISDHPSLSHKNENSTTEPNPFDLRGQVSGFVRAVDHLLRAVASLCDSFTWLMKNQAIDISFGLNLLLKELNNEFEKVVAILVRISIVSTFLNNT